MSIRFSRWRAGSLTPSDHRLSQRVRRKRVAGLRYAVEPLERRVLLSGDLFSGRLYQYSVGSSPKSVAAADFNGDGKPDLVVANYTAAAPSRCC
jgi:hypothetical protein